MQTILDEHIKGSRFGFFRHELFGNSLHFPLVNIFLELLLNAPLDYLAEPDLYAILMAATLQAWWLSGWRYRGMALELPGNLIGPAIYTVIEFVFDGADFFASPHHIAYWAFGFGIGLLQQLRHRFPERFAAALLLTEHLLRTSMLLVMYIILEFLKDEYAGLAPFFADSTHQFVALVVPFLGLALGFAAINNLHYATRLQETAAQLRRYSEWLLGKDRLSLAVANPETLQLARHQRAVLFMDIRGFTRWSEAREPEAVVAMVNSFYECAEPLWLENEAVKVKLTGDEIMLVFAEVQQAVASALALREKVGAIMAPYGLGVGIGVHAGMVVEGLMGTPQYKQFDLLGDTVNTAKRLCDAAAPGEILLSDAARQWLDTQVQVAEQRQLQVKGKEQLLAASVLA